MVDKREDALLFKFVPVDAFCEKFEDGVVVVVVVGPLWEAEEEDEGAVLLLLLLEVVVEYLLSRFFLGATGVALTLDSGSESRRFSLSGSWFPEDAE